MKEWRDKGRIVSMKCIWGGGSPRENCFKKVKGGEEGSYENCFNEVEKRGEGSS